MKSMTIKIEEIDNLEAINTGKYNDEQLEVIASVTRIGQKMPIYVVEAVVNRYTVIDGILRVKGCYDKGQETIEAILIEKNSQQNAKDSYAINVMRQEPSAVKKAVWFVQAIEKQEGSSLNETCMDLNVEMSDVASVSKAQKSKLIKIDTLPTDIKMRLDFIRCPLNTCYELAKGFDTGELQEVHLDKMIDEIVKKSLSENKAKAYIKAFIDNLKIGVEIYSSDDLLKPNHDNSRSKSHYEIKRDVIVINVSKHFQNEDFKLKDIKDEDKERIGEFVDKVLDFLKDKYINSSDTGSNDNTVNKVSNFSTKNAA